MASIAARALRRTGRPAPAPGARAASGGGGISGPGATLLQRRKLDLKAEFESGSSHFSFKRLVSGAFNVVL
jgi:hypothetical protein